MIVTQAELRDRFHSAKRIGKWCADHPDYPDLCRYCGKYWRQWAGSKLDGHAKCIVDDEFKRWLRELLRDPAMTYGRIADAIGVTAVVVRSWTYPIRGGAP